jgi:hypothetical protein
MKISIEIKLPNERAIFVVVLFLQIIGASLAMSSCKQFCFRSIMNGSLTILASLAIGVGCFWQQEDLAYFSKDHAHRGTTLLTLMLLILASVENVDALTFPQIIIQIIDGLYILSSISLAVTFKIRNEVQ